jgi:hypothetical protein
MACRRSRVRIPVAPPTPPPSHRRRAGPPSIGYFITGSVALGRGLCFDRPTTSHRGPHSPRRVRDASAAGLRARLHRERALGPWAQVAWRRDLDRRGPEGRHDHPEAGRLGRVRVRPLGVRSGSRPRAGLGLVAGRPDRRQARVLGGRPEPAPDGRLSRRRPGSPRPRLGVPRAPCREPRSRRSPRSHPLNPVERRSKPPWQPCRRGTGWRCSGGPRMSRSRDPGHLPSAGPWASGGAFASLGIKKGALRRPVDPLSRDDSPVTGCCAGRVREPAALVLSLPTRPSRPRR